MFKGTIMKSHWEKDSPFLAKVKLLEGKLEPGEARIEFPNGFTIPVHVKSTGPDTVVIRERIGMPIAGCFIQSA